MRIIKHSRSYHPRYFCQDTVWVENRKEAMVHGIGHLPFTGGVGAGGGWLMALGIGPTSIGKLRSPQN